MATSPQLLIGTRQQMGTEEECSGQGVILLFVEKIFKKKGGKL